MNNHDIDGARDDALREVLRHRSEPAPLDDVDWTALHARITSAAEPLLEARSTAPAWWQLVAGWSARGIAVAATAAAAALVVIGTDLLPQRPAAADGAAAYAYITLEEELAYGSAALVAAGNDTDAIVDALLFYDEEAR